MVRLRVRMHVVGSPLHRAVAIVSKMDLVHEMGLRSVWQIVPKDSCPRLSGLVHA